MTKKVFKIFLFLFTLIGSLQTINAQTINGTISGTVTDPQGAVIAGAKVTITSVETGTRRDLVTNSDGRFTATGVVVGTYNVRVEATGFAAAVRENVQVNVSENTELNFQLSTGSVEARVEVTAAGELLDTTQSQVTKVVDQQRILELPGRNSLNGLALLNPGVLPNQNGRPGSGFAVNGNRTRSNNFTIDGANNNDQSLSIPRQNLPPEAIRQFQIVTNTFAAEYGRNAGSYVNQITQSGRNDFFGTIFYNWAGNQFDALTTAQQRSFNALVASGLSEKEAVRRARNIAVDQTYGIVIGGPIQKNRTFFFTSIDFNDFRSTISRAARPALTQASRDLLFANRAAFAPGTVDFLLSAFPAANDPTLAGASTAASTVNVTVPGTTTVLPLLFQTYNRGATGGIPYKTNFKRWLAKIDTSLLQGKDNLSFRYLVDTSNDPGSPASLPGLEIGSVVRNDSFTVNDVFTINQNLVNEFRFTYSRRRAGFPENLTAFASGNQFGIGGTFGAFGGGNANFPQSRKDNIYEFTDNVTFIRGNHNFKFGYNLLRYDLNSFFAPNSRGVVNYANLASFLGSATTGDTANLVQKANGTFTTEAVTYEHGIFGQDDWRVNQDLTLNLGLRYEYVTTPLGFFSNAKSDLNNFGPSIGAAYNPKNFLDGRMVLRAGFRISYDQVFQNILLNVSRNYPRVVNNSLGNCVGCRAFLGYNNIPATATTTNNTFGLTVAQFLNRDPSNVPASVAPFIDERLFSPNERINQPESYQGTVSLQYQLASDWVFKAEYITTHGRFLVREYERNYGFSTAVGGTGARLNTTRGSILVGQGQANSEYHAGQFTIERRFGRANIFGFNLGEFSLNANYTYSSFISESDDILGGQTNRTIPADPRNGKLDRGRSGFDQPHRAVISAIYLSPRVFEENAVLDRLFSEWQLSTVTTLASGTPFSILNANNALGILPSQISTVQFSQRVGVNPNGTPGTLTDTTAAGVPLNPNAYYIVYRGNTGILGNLASNSARTPSTYNTNLGVVKNVRTFGETQRLQLRLEIFNLFNRRNFTVIPTNTLFSPGAGQTIEQANSTFLNFGLTNVGGRGFTFGARYFF
jgi:outer membrane receptor protein involved in Fe transport